MNKSYIKLNTLEEDGKLYYNPNISTVESLIPNKFETVHAADLLELPNGDILCCWFAGSDEGNSDISIALSRLDSGKDVWSEAVVVSDDPTRSEQNPSLFLHPNGEIWLMYTAQVPWEDSQKKEFNLQYTAEIRRKISKDNGHTWGPTTTMFDRPGSFCRQKIQVLSNGRWVFGNWICFPDDSRNGSDISVVQISDDQGETWREVEVPNSAGRVHANIIEVESNKLIALFRSRFADNIYIANSEDNGDTWSEPIRTELPNNNSGISAIKLKDSSIAIVYNPISFNDKTDKTVWPFQRSPVQVAISKDNGKTWPYRRTVEFGEGYAGKDNDINNRRYEYPVVIQGENADIHIAYSWGNRRCVKYVKVDKDWVGYEKNK